MPESEKPFRWCAIIVAAGRGTRFGGPKQLVEIGGRPMIAWSIATFAQIPEIEHLVITTEPEFLETVRRIAAIAAPGKETSVVPGGATRQISVRNGLEVVPATCDSVLVHDGARPLVTVRDIRSGMREVRLGRASLLATPVIDTIKVVPGEDRVVARSLERTELWAAQTPQFAMLSDMRAAHAAAERSGLTVTDDAALLEAGGVTVVVVPTTEENLKITRAEDRVHADLVVRARMQSSAT